MEAPPSEEYYMETEERVLLHAVKMKAYLIFVEQGRRIRRAPVIPLYYIRLLDCINHWP